MNTMSNPSPGEQFQESVVQLHEYLKGLGFVAAASGVINDIRNTLRHVESTDLARLNKRQRRLQESNSMHLREVLMRLTGDDDGRLLSAWTTERRPPGSSNS